MKEWYRCSADEVLREFGTSSAGLDRKEVIRRRRQFGEKPGDRKPERSALENLF